MIYLTKRIDFSAAHWLHNPALSAEENKKIFAKDNNPGRHGHNYVLEVTVKGEKDPKSQMVMNLNDLKRLLMERIYEKVDHRDLTTEVDFLKGVIPTSENLAIAFWNIIQKNLPQGVALDTVRLYETENGWITYRGDNE